MWKPFNNLAYRLYFAYRNRLSRRVNRRWAVRVSRPPGGEPSPVLYVAWGRIGDVVLATGHLKHLRRWFHPHPVWFLGRPQVRPVVERFVDAFLTIPPPEGLEAESLSSSDAFESAMGRPFRYVIGDIHLFYGGLFSLGPLLASLRADRKFVYEGFHLGNDLAPERPYPDGFEVVPAFRPRDTGPGETGGLHILHHNARYIRRVLERCGVGADKDSTWRPDLDHVGSGTDACRRSGLEPGEFIGWQPCSDNRRKDYPQSHWEEVIAAFPHQQFVALVQPGRAAGVERTAPAGVRVIEIGLTGAMELIREARLFVGLDSGLSHIATVLGTPTVCVCPDSHLGYFFPYPEDYGYANLRTVAHPDYLACRGCFMTCRHEPFTSTVTRGALCLRTLPSRLVIEAIRAAL